MRVAESSQPSRSRAVCPLCQSKELSRVDEVSLHDLDQLYQEQFQLQIAGEFRGGSSLVLYACAQCTLRHFHPIQGGSPQFYRQLNQHRWYYLEEKREYRSAATAIPAGAKVLDIGCGEGAFARWIPSCTYVGLEKNRSLVEGEGEDQPLILAETVEEHAPGHEERYDVVTFFQVLEHVVDVSSFLEQSLRCLRSGGKLIVSVPAADSFVSQTVNGLLNLPPHHLTWWSDASLLYLGRKYEMELESMTHEPLEKMHYRRYAFNWALSLISGWVGYPLRLIDRSIRYQMLSLAALPLALGRWFLLHLSPSAMVGHSVVAVFRKAK